MVSGRPSMTRPGLTVPSPVSCVRPHLLASVKRLRCGASTWPTMDSLAPKPYSAAVSKCVTPASSAASSSASACSGGGATP